MRGARTGRGAGALAAAALLLCARAGRADGTAPDSPAPGPPAATAAARPPDAWQLELKSAVTERGSTDESTRTTFRVERLLPGPVSLLRLDVPWVNKDNAFLPEPGDSGLGDVKVRVGTGPWPVGGATGKAFLDATLPTAQGSTLGGGKWQLGPGASMVLPLRAPGPGGGGPSLTLGPLLQQFVAVAGDPARKDVCYTQAELDLQATWPGAAILSVNPKPVVDWTQGAATAAVLDLKGTWLASPRWRAWLKAGARLWGGKLPGTYGKQVELGVRLTL